VTSAIILLIIFLNSLRIHQNATCEKQLAEVDPIVASFCGGAVGVLSALLVVEQNNVKEHQKQRCFYCQGTGYLVCGGCGGKPLISMDGPTSSVK
jgi:hypothetical protein